METFSVSLATKCFQEEFVYFYQEALLLWKHLVSYSKDVTVIFLYIEF